MNKIAVSIIIPHYNKWKYLQKCLQSVFQMRTRFPFEVIVLDNASLDDSVAGVKKEFPQVELVELGSNYLFAHACNVGIKKAKGKYVALLNNDTEVDPRWLEELICALENHPDVGFCASRVYFMDRLGTLDSAGDAYTIAGCPYKIGHLVDKVGAYPSDKLVFGASASSSIYRRELFDKVGMFDEELYFGQEDVDLSFRAQLMGYKCLFVANAIVRHKVSATIGYQSHKYIYFSQRNIEFVYYKNMPFILLLKYLPVHIVYVFGAMFFALKKGRILNYLHGKISFLLHLPSILHKRRIIQRTKTVSDKYIESIIEKKWFMLKLKKAISQ